MKVGRFQTETGSPRVGVVTDHGVADLTAFLPGDAAAVIATLTRDVVAELARLVPKAPHVDSDAVRWITPIPRPPKFFGIGLNYGRHASEGGMTIPTTQLWFNKQPTCVIGPNESIVIPAVSTMVDYEGELAFIVNQRCRAVPISAALSVIGGYTVCNDVSVRDWQRASPTMTLGKSFDTHGPLGPLVVTVDELGDGVGLRLVTTVNGEIRQDGCSDDLIVGVAAMIAHLSTVCTLEPGDVITTGTPAGVGSSFDPPRWLQPGDLVEVSIEGIGTLRNPVEAELKALAGH